MHSGVSLQIAVQCFKVTTRGRQQQRFYCKYLCELLDKQLSVQNMFLDF